MGPVKLKPTDDGKLFISWEEEGITLLLHSVNPTKLRAWAKLFATAPDMMNTIINIVTANGIRPDTLPAALTIRKEMKLLQGEIRR